MTDSRSHSETIKASLKRRNAAERRFRFYGMLAISFAVACLGILFFTILSKGISAFQQTYIQIDIHFDSEQIDPKKSKSSPSNTSSTTRSDEPQYI